jgi:hypothetical protein
MALNEVDGCLRGTDVPLVDIEPDPGEAAIGRASGRLRRWS